MGAVGRFVFIAEIEPSVLRAIRHMVHLGAIERAVGVEDFQFDEPLALFGRGEAQKTGAAFGGPSLHFGTGEVGESQGAALGGGLWLSRAWGDDGALVHKAVKWD